ncbi:hypothetical protein DFO59_103631 [Pseudomonas fluorescens]|nr:hypothetical protein DFO59_103631 [Pseudomonas fluorescens]
MGIAKNSGKGQRLPKTTTGRPSIIKKEHATKKLKGSFGSPLCCLGFELFLWERACSRRRPAGGLDFVDRVHIRCCGNGGLGFRPYGGSLLRSAKVSKTLLPHHSAPRLGSVCPRSRSKARARARARAGHMPASMWLGHCYREQARSHTGSSADPKPMCTAKPVGASLLAKRPAHPTSSSTVAPPSRASPLPQGILLSLLYRAVLRC